MFEYLMELFEEGYEVFIPVSWARTRVFMDLECSEYRAFKRRNHILASGHLQGALHRNKQFEIRILIEAKATG